MMQWKGISIHSIKHSGYLLSFGFVCQLDQLALFLMIQDARSFGSLMNGTQKYNSYGYSWFLRSMIYVFMHPRGPKLIQYHREKVCQPSIRPFRSELEKWSGWLVYDGKERESVVYRLNPLLLLLIIWILIHSFSYKLKEREREITFIPSSYILITRAAVIRSVMMMRRRRMRMSKEGRDGTERITSCLWMGL